MATETKWGHGKSGTMRHIVDPSRRRIAWGMSEPIPMGLCSGLDIEAASIGEPTIMRMEPCKRCLKKAGLSAEEVAGV